MDENMQVEAHVGELVVQATVEDRGEGEGVLIGTLSPHLYKGLTHPFRYTIHMPLISMPDGQTEASGIATDAETLNTLAVRAFARPHVLHRRASHSFPAAFPACLSSILPLITEASADCRAPAGPAARTAGTARQRLRLLDAHPRYNVGGHDRNGQDALPARLPGRARA
eukprot:6742683-Prymnesium_polylepis.1